MFLNLSHTRLNAFTVSKQLVLEAYKLAGSFPTEEKFGIVSQIRRAALSVHLNISEGCSRKSGIERTRFFEISRGSLIEVDTAIGIACDLKYCSELQAAELGNIIIETFKILSGLLTNKKTV